MLTEEISKRFWITRFSMIIGIVILHLPPYEPLTQVGTSAFSLLKAFFAHGLFRATVPVLTVISGYLVFYSNLHLRPLELFKKKTKSILVPLVLWNLPIAIAVFFVQKYQILGHQFSAQLYPPSLLDWLNALIGVTADPVNYPLNFLRDLFVISILSPVLWLFLKTRPYLGLITVLVIWHFNLDGDLILRTSMLVNFYIGGLAAVRRWDLAALDKYANWCLLLLISVCIGLVAFRIENRELFRLISPFLVWPCMKFFVGTRVGEWLSKYAGSSFFIFLSHSVVLLALWLVFKKSPASELYFVYWLLTPPITVLLLIFVHRKFRESAPRLSLVFLGGRE